MSSCDAAWSGTEAHERPTVGAFRGSVGAVWAGCCQQWRRAPSLPVAILTVVPFVDVPLGAAYGYVIRLRGDPEAVLYVAFGVVLVSVWNRGVIQLSWTLADEFTAGTFESSMVSRSPLAIIVTGKVISMLARDAIFGVGGCVAVLVVGQAPQPPLHAPLAVGSAFVAALSVTCTLMVFSPFAVLAGSRAGAFNGILAIGTVLNGFLVPVQSFPLALQIPARILPTSWATDALWASLAAGDLGLIVRNWCLALVEAAGLLALTLIAFREVERRVRIKGAAHLV